MSTLPAEISQKVPNPLLHNLGVVQNMGAPRLKAKVKMPVSSFGYVNRVKLLPLPFDARR